MSAMASASCRAASAVMRSTQAPSRRMLHGSAARLAITNLQMPAMSPTMTEGGIASWKKKEGEAFVQGDILLEIETDKATIDVEAQDDGILGKILAQDGTKAIPVGKVIALLAEEGDDISNLEAPKEEAPAPPKKEETTSSSSSTASSSSSAPLHKSDSQPPQSSESHSHAVPEHSRPLFPSVLRLLAEHNIAKPSEIKGTGVRGMLTKGDVLAYVGQASGPLGTFKFGPSPIEEALTARTKTGAPGAPPAAPKKVTLDGPAIRRLIVGSMYQTSQKARNPGPVGLRDADFDSVIADYLPQRISKSTSSPVPAPPAKKAADFLDGLH